MLQDPIKFFILMALVLPLGIFAAKWKYDTCIDEGLSKTYCMQRVFLK